MAGTGRPRPQHTRLAVKLVVFSLLAAGIVWGRPQIARRLEKEAEGPTMHVQIENVFLA